MKYSTIKLYIDQGILHLLISNFATQFMGFGTALLVAKFLKPEELGLIYIIQSYALFFILISEFGINTAILKFCSQQRSEEERHQILKTGIAFSLIISVIVFLLILVLSFTEILASREASFWIVIYSVILPFAAITDLLTVYLQSQKCIKEMAMIQVLLKIILVVFIIILTYFFGFKGFIAGTILSYIVGVIPLLKIVGTKFLKAKMFLDIRNFLNFAFFSLMANGTNMLGNYVDTYLMDHLIIERSQIGYYYIANLFVTAISQVTSTAQSFVTPFFCEKADDGKWMKKNIVRVQVIIIGVSIMGAIFTYLAAYVVITLFYGSQYISSLAYLQLLLIKYIIWSSFAIIGVGLVALGAVKFNFLVVLISTPLRIALAYVLIFDYGIKGIVWSQIVANILMLTIVVTGVIILLKKLFPETGEDYNVMSVKAYPKK